MRAQADAAARRAMALRHRPAQPGGEAERDDAALHESIVARAAEVAASAGMTFWGRLHGADRSELLSMAAAREFAAREPLFHVGDTADGAFVLVDGWVRIIVPSLTGHEDVTVAVRGPGELVGEGGALCGIPRSATVEALDGDLRALEIPGELFSAFLEANPLVARLVERIIWRRLRDANELSTIITITSHEPRLAAVVCKLAESHREVHPPAAADAEDLPPGDAAKERPVSLPVSATDLASMSALPSDTVETITRQWRAGGILASGATGISVRSLSALREIRAESAGDGDGVFGHNRESRAVRAWQGFQQFQADVLEQLERIPEHSAPGSPG